MELETEMGLWDEPEQKTTGIAEIPAKKPEIAKVRYTHDAIIDEILTNPAISQGELAKMFGFTQAWMSIMINSDAFQERMRERKCELVDPRLVATLEDRLNGVARSALDALLEKLEQHTNKTLPMKTMELIATAKLGVGDRANRMAAPVQQNNLYVVALPGVSPDSSSWRNSAQGISPAPPPPGGITDVVEMQPGV